jgi:hypothetical protein
MNIVDETLVAATVPECRGELREPAQYGFGLVMLRFARRQFGFFVDLTNPKAAGYNPAEVRRKPRDVGNRKYRFEHT